MADIDRAWHKNRHKKQAIAHLPLFKVLGTVYSLLADALSALSRGGAAR